MALKKELENTIDSLKASVAYYRKTNLELQNKLDAANEYCVKAVADAIASTKEEAYDKFVMANGELLKRFIAEEISEKLKLKTRTKENFEEISLVYDDEEISEDDICMGY